MGRLFGEPRGGSFPAKRHVSLSQRFPQPMTKPQRLEHRGSPYQVMVNGIFGTGRAKIKKPPPQRPLSPGSEP